MTPPTAELAATRDDQSEVFRLAMLYHSDRADALMKERDDLATENAALRVKLDGALQMATRRREALRGQALGIERMKITIREMKNQNRISKIGLRDTKELAEAGLRIANQRSQIAALTKALTASAAQAYASGYAAATDDVRVMRASIPLTQSLILCGLEVNCTKLRALAGEPS